MKALLGAGAAGFFVAVAILLLSWTPYFSELNSTAYDFTLRLAGPVPITSPTVIVAIDDDSLRRQGQWPWSREKLAKLVNRIESARPLTIAVDLLLDDKGTPEGDDALAAAISNTHAIVLGAHVDSTGGTERWLEPNAAFLQKHVHMGHVHTDPGTDFDTINRLILSVKATGAGRMIPAFAVEALRTAGLPIKADFQQKIQSAEVIRPEPINIRFVGDNYSFRHIPAWQVLAGVTPVEEFAKKIVLIGVTAEGTEDQWFTPFALSGKKMSGVEIHANAIETLYAGRAIKEVEPAYLVTALALLVVLLWWLDRRFEGWRFYVASILTGPAVLFLSWALMRYANLWMPFPTFWALTILAVPGLEVTKLVRLNRDLDGKIQRLTGDWLDALRWYGQEGPRSSSAMAKSARLLRRSPRNARWKLHAIDFFNRELTRFLSFNNTILASIEDAIIVCDTDGNVVYQNPAAKGLPGYRENPGLVSDYLASILDGREFPAGPGVFNFVPTRDGKTFYNVTVAPTSTAGVVFSLHNATAQHELNQAKSEMVSLVSHELRTPLTAIRGYSDMLLQYGLVEEKGREFLGTIVDESDRLNKLIQSFLDIAYIESGRQKISRTEFEVAPVLRDMITLLNPVAADKQITLEPPADLNGMRVRADRLLLYQALTNLVTNAIKYSPPGTKVSVGVSNSDGASRFSIADQGYGIPTEEVSKVFEKFYRRGNRETKEQSGFGLGLAFVKEVATRHGGNVIVESEVGKGSVFTLWIPG